VRIINKRIAVLISSCDKYHDLWDPFFTLFFKYWPDCPYPVYLSANNLEYEHQGVKTINMGEDTDWSSGFRKTLEKISQPYVIVLMEDYLLTGPVDTAMVERLIEYMESKRAACLRIFPCPGPDLPCADNQEIGEIRKGSAYRLSLQAAIWDKKILTELIRDGESAWELELNGTKRTNDLDVPFLSVTGLSPIPYYCTAVVKGKWVKEAVELCRKEGIKIDLKKRPAQTFIDRLKTSEVAGRLIGSIKDII
jgi:hypothetical protein